MSIVFGTDKPVKKIIDSFFGIFGIDNGIYWWYTDLRKQKNTEFLQNFQVFIDIFSNSLYNIRCAVLALADLFTAPSERAVSSKCRLFRAAGILTGGVSTWQRNVPISPRSCTARRSTASAREWRLPTAARFWPVAAPRAAPVCPTKRNGPRGRHLNNVFGDGGNFRIPPSLVEFVSKGARQVAV